MHSRFAAWSMFAFLTLVPAAQEPAPAPAPQGRGADAAEPRRPARPVAEQRGAPQGRAPLRGASGEGRPAPAAARADRDHGRPGLGRVPVRPAGRRHRRLGRARALLAALTPAQLALTAAELPARPELWPLRLKLTADIGLENGAFIPAGGDVSLRGFEGGMLSVYDRGTQAFFPVDPYETDIVPRARAALAAAPQEPFFVRALEAALTGDEAAAAAAHPLAGADFLLVYGGRKGCSRCAEFLPALQDFYARDKAKGGFEVLFLSQDATAEDARAYAAEAKPPGRIIPFERRVEAAHVATIPGQLLPAVYLFDRAGNLLLRNHPNGGSPSARDVLGDLEQRLAERRSATEQGRKDAAK